MAHSVSIDWFQTHNSSTPHLTGTEYGRFLIKNIGRKASFSNVFEVYEAHKIEGEKVPGEKVAVLAANPDSGFLKPDSSFLKIENKFLYINDLKALVQELNDSLGLTFKNVSRIDLACDFDTFKNNLDPEVFIERHVSGRNPKYTKLRKSKVHLELDHGNENRYRYARWGTANSNFCYYLYNKDVEMKEKKNKPWIREKWLRDKLEGSKDVWRLEFRIHSCSKGLIDGDAQQELKNYRKAKQLLKVAGASMGEDQRIKLEEIVSTWKDNQPEVMADAKYFSTLDVLSNFEEVYRGLFHHYFDFRYNDGQKKKCRMKKIPLLDLQKPGKAIMDLVDKMESNRTDKIILAGLIRLNNEMRVKEYTANANDAAGQRNAFADEKFFSNIKEMMNYYTHTRDLQEWRERKFPDQSENQKLKVS